MAQRGHPDTHNLVVAEPTAQLDWVIGEERVSLEVQGELAQIASIYPRRSKACEGAVASLDPESAAAVSLSVKAKLCESLGHGEQWSHGSGAEYTAVML